MIYRPNVNLDVDGVLADFVTPYLETLYQLTGVRRYKEEIKTWEIKESLGLTPDVAKEMSRRIKSPGWCASIPVFPEAIDGVKRLKEISNVHILTSPWDGPYWAGERIEWLKQHFGIKSDEVTQTHHKYKFRGDLIVDDKYTTVEKWAAAHPQGIPVLWDTPHNGTDPDKWRVKGWDHLLHVVSMHEVL